MSIKAIKERKQQRCLLATTVVATALGLAVSPLAFGGHTPSHKTMKSGRGAMKHSKQHIVFTPGSIKWMAGPPGLPPGGKVAILEGNPSKPGPFTMRGKCPAGYKIPAHWHPADERVTVLSGALHIGAGDKLDTTKGKTVPAGGFTLMPAKMHHFAWFDKETILQINGNGPWNIIYLNPADDPRHKGGKH
ncbi:MAG: cupin domain-containing protein [Armatimonadota bacterium]|nr:cupin domain-containing protein [Armatimonadota bacterium]